MWLDYNFYCFWWSEKTSLLQEQKRLGAKNSRFGRQTKGLATPLDGVCALAR